MTTRAALEKALNTLKSAKFYMDKLAPANKRRFEDVIAAIEAALEEKSNG